MSDDEIPKFELASDAHFEESDSRERRDEEDLSNTYLRLLFENYENETIREVLGEQYEEKKQRYNEITEGSDRDSESSSDREDVDSPDSSEGNPTLYD